MCLLLEANKDINEGYSTVLFMRIDQIVSETRN